MGKSRAAALLTRDSKVPRKEKKYGGLTLVEAPLFAGFEGEGEGVRGLVVAAEAEAVVIEGEAVRMPVVAATEAEVVVRVF
jgi:hypothetical protein